MNSGQKSKPGLLQPLRLPAPAKVNLRLKITGRRPDGYHLLDMVMVKLDLADEIALEIGGETIEFTADREGLPTDSSNTIVRAAEIVRELSGKEFGARIRLKKRIPVAAGLGGGSSDAATVLNGLNRLLGLGWDGPRLSKAGLRIGADLPFFLAGGSQRVRGIGEVLEPMEVPPLYLVLINPGFPVSTAEAYRWYDEGGDSKGPLTSPPPLASFPPPENDLERVVIPRYPVLGRLKELLNRAGALGTLMSGSGPTVFGLFESPESRDRGYKEILLQKETGWWVCRTNNLGGEDSNLD